MTAMVDIASAQAPRRGFVASVLAFAVLGTVAAKRRRGQQYHQPNIESGRS
jgi:hypothetical protein